MEYFKYLFSRIYPEYFQIMLTFLHQTMLKPVNIFWGACFLGHLFSGALNLLRHLFFQGAYFSGVLIFPEHLFFQGTGAFIFLSISPRQDICHVQCHTCTTWAGGVAAAL